jgi:putative molybdopterin biosynthesis protein
MEPIQRIQKFEQFKILGDPRRMVILQRLMSRPETLSSLGRALGVHPAQVRHHLKLLEKAGLVELVSTQVVRGFVEKYYRAKASAFVYDGIILPVTPGAGGDIIVAVGSHDLALELLAQRYQQGDKKNRVLTLPVGSLEGLIALRQGSAHLAGCHLLDTESGEYNLPYVRHFFPDRPTQLFTLAYREQGLLLPPGNPQQIHDLEDLFREDVVLVNRNPGSGTRIWFDRQLQRLGGDPRNIRGYRQEVRTHTAAARAISEGKAGVGVGLRASARQFGLDFIPLFQERYDLVLPLEQASNPALMPLLDTLQSGSFRQEVRSLGGYDTAHTGEQRVP